MKTYRFIKEGGEWYIDLPEYIQNGGNKGDLQMVEGADTMLEMMSQNKQEVFLIIDRESFPGANVLNLVERCDPYIGGGYYYLSAYEGDEINKTIWLCGVTEFVFGDLPSQIFVRKV